MIFIYILLCLSSFLLIALVLMQDSKSGLGGLTGATTMSTFGANTDKTLIKMTGVVAGAFFLLVILIHVLGKNGLTSQKSLMPEASPKTAKKEINVDLKEAATKGSAPVTGKTTETEPAGTSVTLPIKDAKEITPEAKQDAPKSENGNNAQKEENTEQKAK